MTQSPKVSFVCSVRNGEEDIVRCSLSVLNQSLSDIELVFVDDHSSDSTWGMMESMARSDERIRAIKNYGREGLTYSLNMGIDFSRGEYIARIDVDDFAHSNRAEAQVNALEGNPEAVMVASCSRVVDDDDYEMYSQCPSCDHRALKWSLCFRNNIRHSTAMWRRSLYLRYDPQFKYAQDYEMWCRMSDLGPIAVVPSILATIRNKRGSITNTKHSEQELYADMIASRRFARYTGESLGGRESKCLRMVHHLRSPEQFSDLQGMTSEEVGLALDNYFRLAERFIESEGPNGEQMMNDIANDIRSMLSDPTHKETAKKAVERMLGGGSSGVLVEAALRSMD